RTPALSMSTSVSPPPHRPTLVSPSFPTLRSSDLGRVLFALSIAAFPEELPRDTLSAIFSGAQSKVREAGGTLAGGHTIRDAEPKDRKSTRLNSSHLGISYAVFCLKKNTRRVSAAR